MDCQKETNSTMVAGKKFSFVCIHHILSGGSVHMFELAGHSTSLGTLLDNPAQQISSQ